VSERNHILALSGGVGGAKLALGLSRVVPSESLTVVANTGDDFTHMGFHISPDIDTLLYTLAGLANPETGWGRQGETWSFMEAAGQLGAETWFNLGDKDLALHVARTQRLTAGASLSEVTSELAKVMDIHVEILPMSNDPIRTIVETAKGPLAFQHYFVRDRCEPEVSGFFFKGMDEAKPNPKFMQRLVSKHLETIIICPSNPFVSVDPILRINGIKNVMRECSAPIIAVSPIIGGKAVKGPAAKMMKELKLPVTALSVAKFYKGLIDGFVIDIEDEDIASEIESLGMKVLITQTFMKTLEDREALAAATLEFSSGLKSSSS
jgi:LPPG:FO 2-phospho-L-lactate transferase